MGQRRASNFAHGLSCVVEEAPSQDNVAAAAEQRRQHILESMAKLEGNPKAATTGSLSPPTQRISRPSSSTKSHLKAGPISQQFEPFPCRQSFTGFAATPQIVPFVYYYPVYPAPLPPTRPYFVERNSIYLNPLLSDGSTNLKHFSAPTNSQGRTNQELGTTKMQQERLSNAHHNNANNRRLKLNEVMKTPEKLGRSRSTVVSPESSPDSFVRTPPPILKYNSSNNPSNSTKNHPKLKFSNAHQQRQKYQDEDHVKQKMHPIQPVVVDQRSNQSNESKKKVEKNQFGNLVGSNNYALQLESKKTGIKLMEKKRLTLDEMKVLESLPPLPPRPDPRRKSSLTSPSPSSKKDKKDPFAWFRY